MLRPVASSFWLCCRCQSDSPLFFVETPTGCITFFLIFFFYNIVFYSLFKEAIPKKNKDFVLKMSEFIPSKVTEFSYVCLLVIKCQGAPRFIWLQQQHLSGLLGVPSPPIRSCCSHLLLLGFFSLCVFKFSGSALTVLTSVALEKICLFSAAVLSLCRAKKNLARLKQTFSARVRERHPTASSAVESL